MNKQTTCCCGCMKRGILDQYPDKCEQLEAYLSELDLKQPIEKRRGYLIATLHFAQNLFGYLPLEVQEFIADRLMLQQSDVYGVISFYSYFTDKPVGKYQIHVCTGTACFVKGADKILAEFKEQLKIEEGETTPDGKFSIGALRCVGACSLAPVVMVNDRVYGNVTPKMVKKIIADFTE